MTKPPTPEPCPLCERTDKPTTASRVGQTLGVLILLAAFTAIVAGAALAWVAVVRAIAA